MSYRTDFEIELEKNHCAVCPHCQRTARINKLRVHSTLALMLARLYYCSGKQYDGNHTGFIHIEKFRPQTRTGNDFSIVKHWDLARPMAAGVSDDKNSSGLWKLTDHGIAFVENKVAIQKYAFVLDDEVKFFSAETQSMEQAVQKKFKYSELFERMAA